MFKNLKRRFANRRASCPAQVNKNSRRRRPRSELLEDRRLLTTAMQVVSAGTNEVALPDFDENLGTLQHAQVDVSVASATTGANVIPDVEHTHLYRLVAVGGGAGGGWGQSFITSPAGLGNHTHMIPAVPTATITAHLFNPGSSDVVAPLTVITETDPDIQGQSHSHQLSDMTFETLGGTYFGIPPGGAGPIPFNVGSGTATNGVFVPRNSTGWRVTHGFLTVRITAANTQTSSAGDFTHAHSVSTSSGIFNSSGSLNSVNPTGNSNHSHVLDVDVGSRSFADPAELATYFASGSSVPLGVSIGTTLGHTHSVPSRSTTSTTTFTYDAVPVAATDGPYIANEGDTLRFDASASFDDVGIVSYEWDFDFNGSFELDANGPVAFHAFTDDFATRNVAIRVTDTLGQQTIETTTLTINGVAPTVTASFAQSSLPGVTTDFDLGSFIDAGDDGPFDIRVDWGDGTPATEFTLATVGPIGTRSHSYTTAGDYTITVNVTDADSLSGSATTSVAVNTLPAANVSMTANTVGEDVGTITVQVDLDSPATGRVIIPLLFSGTATEGSDYQSSANSIVIDDGQSSGFITVTIADDVLSEDTEELIVTLGTPVNARVDDNSVQIISISDNDAPPSVSFTQAIQIGAEGSTLNVVARLSAVAGRDVTVPLHFSGSAEKNVDYFVDGDDVLVIPAGQTAASLAVGVVDDNLGEANELAIVSMDAPMGASLSTAPGDTTQHTIRIPVSDTPTIGFVSANQGLSEATEDFQVVVNLSGPSTVPVTFELAKPTTDTPAATELLTFVPGEITQVRNFSIDDDNVNEPDENLTFTLGATSNAILGASSRHTVTIRNDDISTISVDTASIEVFEDAGLVSFDVELSQPSATDVTVPVSFEGSAKLGDDFAAPTTTVTIPAGQLSTTGSFTLVDDAIRESREQLYVRLGNPGNSGTQLGTDRAFAVSILDDDPEVGFSTDVRRLGEDDGQITVRASLSAATNVDVVVPIQVLPGSAWPNFLPLRSPDFDAPPFFTITIPAGSLSATSDSITIVNDSRVESSETFALQMLPAANANAATEATGLSTFQTIRIIDNDDPTPTISLSTSQPMVAEGGRLAVDLDIELSSASTSDLTLDLSYSGTATKGVDFVAPGTVNVVAGSRSATATILIVDDNISKEGDETIKVNVDPGLSLTGFKTGGGVSFTLRDNDRSSSVPRQNSVKPTISKANQSTASLPMTLAVTSELGDGVDLDPTDLDGISDPDPSFNAADNQSFFGVGVIAIGGAFAGSTLFFDANFNGLLDAGEPSTVTAFDASASLTIPDSFDVNDDALLDVTEGQLVLAGGVDTATNSPLELRLTAPAGYFAVSMMSTLVNGLIRDHGFSLADAESRVLTAMNLPDVNLHSLDMVQEAASGNAAATSVFAGLAELEDTIVPIANLITGIDGAPSIDVVGDLLSADIAGKIVEPDAVLDLTIVGNVESLIEGTLFATGLSLGRTTIEGVAQVIAQANQRIRDLPQQANASYLQDVARIQKVLQGDFADDLGMLGGGAVAIADVVADYTGAEMDARIAAASPGTVVAPLLFIDDVVKTEGDSGTVTLDFTVFLVNDPSEPVSVQWATADDTSTVIDGDYQSDSGQLTWAAGDTSSRTISITANSDTDFELDESFKVILSDPVNAAIRREIGYGFLVNDEAVQIASDGLGDKAYSVALSDASYQITENGSVIFEASTPASQVIEIAGSADGDDSIVLDLSANTFRSDQVRFDGQSGSGADEASVVGGAFEMIDVQVNGADGGQTQLSPTDSSESLLFDWSGLESFTLDVAGVADLVIALPTDVTTAVLEDADIDDSELPGMMQLSSTSGEFAPVYFINPSGTLTIRGGNGNGAITAGQLDPAFAATLVVESTDAVDDVGGEVNVSEDAGAVNITAAMLANDIDPQGDSFSVGQISDGVSIVTTAGPGSITLGNGAIVSLDSDGTVRLDPNGQFESLADGSSDTTSTFQYQITDASGAVDDATVNVTITGQNDAPDAVDVSRAVDEDGPGISVEADYSDVDTNDTHTFSVDTRTTLGSVVNNGDGTFNYDPNGAFESLAAGETVTDTFTYSVTDDTDLDEVIHQHQSSNVASMGAPSVTDVAQSFQAIGDIITGAGVKTFAFGGGISGDITISLYDKLPVDGGTLLASGTATDVADDGSDAFVTWNPVAVVPGQTLFLVFSVANESSGVLRLGGAAGGQYAEGQLFLGNSPEPGLDLAFSTQTIDTTSNSDSATVSITVTGQNDAPIAVDLTGTVSEDESQLIYFTPEFMDPDINDTHTFSINNDDTIGFAAVDFDGNIFYTPSFEFEYLAAGETAIDTFTYTVDDGNGGVSTATVTMTVIGQNDQPFAITTTAEANEDGPAITIAADVSDADISDTHTFAFDLTFTNGSVIDHGDGTATYDPKGAYDRLAVGEQNEDVIEYIVSDGNGGSSRGVIFVTIIGENDAPVIVDDTNAITEQLGDELHNIVTGNIIHGWGSPNQSPDSDPDFSDVLEVDPDDVKVHVGTYGNLTMPNSGSYLYVLGESAQQNESLNEVDTGEIVLDVFPGLTIIDGNGGSDDSALTITITGTTDNTAPVIAGDDNAAFSISENNTSVIADLQSSDDFDSEGNGLVYSIDGGEDAGLFAIDASTGELAFINGADYEGASANGDDFYEVTVKVSDNGPGTSLSDTQDVSVEVTDLQAFVSIADAAASEGDDVTFAITTTGDNVLVAYDLSYSSAPDTASAGDFSETNGSLSSTSGDPVSGPIIVGTVEDDVVEPDEAFTVSLGGVTGTNDVTIVSSQATGTITNDDSATLTIADDVVVEGNPGDATQLVFEVSLDRPVDADVSFDYESQEGTAIGGQDFSAVSGTLTIPSGSTTGQITVDVTGDQVVEIDEMLTVLASNLQSAGRDVTLVGTGTAGGGDWVQLEADIDGEAAGDESGWSLAMSGDGDTVVVGTPFNDGNGDRSGHVRVYRFDGSGWNQLGDDFDGEAEGDESGYSVAISDDGNTIAMGARGYDGNGINSGHTRVYRFDGIDWYQLGDDIDGEAAFDQSGVSVAMSADGNTVLIGASQNDGTDQAAGHVRIYRFDGAVWSQVGGDIDGEAAFDLSGLSVATNDEGDMVVVGAFLNDGGGTNSGHARVYRFNGIDWFQIGGDIDGEFAGDLAGVSVGMSGSGSIVAIGASANDGNGSNAGHTRVFEFDGTHWIQLGDDIDGEAFADSSGLALAMSDDGQTVAIGAPNNDGGGTDTGHARVYRFDGLSWTQVGSDIDGEAAGDLFASSLGMNGDGSAIVVGARFNDGSATNAGHARVYRLSPTPVTVSGTIINDDNAPVVQPGGPYVIDEGTDLTLNGSASSDADGDPLTYRWDVDGDGDFDENVTGPTPTVPWTDLVGLGIDNGPDGPRHMRLEVSDGANPTGADVPLTIDNVAPVATNDSLETGEDAVLSVSALALVENDSDANPLDSLTVASIDTSGTVGSVSATVDGAFVYDPNGQFESLPAGQTTTDSFNYTLDDGDNGSDTATVTVTINGVNDAASISGTALGTTDEDSTTDVTGALAVADVDDGEDVFAPQTGSAGSYGAFSIDAAGNWTYVLDKASVQDLNADDVVSESFTVTSVDGTASEDVVVTINGLNDVASISGTAVGTTDEDSTTDVTGALAVSDVDEGEAVFTPQTGSASSYGAFSIDEAGNWAYVLDNASVQDLNAGDVVSESFTVTSVDGTASEEVVVTINGLNDVASIIGTAVGTTDEDATTAVTGALAVSDVDEGEAVFTPQTGSASSYGVFSIDEAGNWAYVLDNASVQDLNAGDVVSESFTVTSVDGTASEEVVVTINGLNDVASIIGTAVGTTDEDATTAVTGALAVSDVDEGEAVFTPQTGSAGSYGAFSIDEAGNWTYVLDNASVQELNAGDVVTDSFTVTSVDGTASEEVVVTINGLNDVASISGTAAGTTDEDATTDVTGALAVSDVDEGEAVFTPQTGSASSYGAFSIDEAGNWAYVLDNASVQELNAGDVVTESFTVTSVDGTASEDVVVTINGLNDAASISGTAVGTTDEDATTDVTGSLAVADVDAGEAVFTPQTGSASSYGVFSIDEAGNWTFVLDNASVQELNDGDVVTDNFTVTSVDGTASEVVVVTINGLNDAASISGTAVGTTDEDATTDVTGTLAVADVDAGEAVFTPQSGSAGSYGAFSIDAAGNWTYVLDNASVQALAANEAVGEEFAVGSVDGTASETVTITIAGVNDEPTIESLSSSNATVDENSADGEVSINGTFSDIDTSDIHTVMVDWGDGSILQEIAVDQATKSFAGTHDFATGGVFEITVTVDDGNGGVAVHTASAVTEGVGLVEGTLYVIGTNTRDHVSLKVDHRNKQLDVDAKLNQGNGSGNSGRVQVSYDLADVNRIVSYLMGGDDYFDGSGVKVTQFVFGGLGADHLVGGDSSNVLVGGVGNDLLFGGAAADILIGGFGEDNLKGRGGDDLLIGGAAEKEDDLSAVEAALAGWKTGDLASVLVDLGDILDDEEEDDLKGEQGDDVLLGGLGDKLKQ